MSQQPPNALGRNYIPDNEEQRLAALRTYDVLMGPSEEALNNIAHILAEDMDMPFAMVSLVDADEVLFKGNYGLSGVRSTPRGMSLCSLVILSEEPTVIVNAADDPCLLDNPLVHGDFGLRFYAGAPIITPEGYPLGAVCVFDKKERELTPKQQARLVRYAAIVMHELTLRRAFWEERKAHEAETAIRQRLITREVVKAQEKERTEIGLELHDNVSQVLTTIKLYNEMVRDGVGDTRTILDRSNHYLQSCINEIRSLSHRLSLPTLGKISFSDSVLELVSMANRTGKLHIDCNLEGVADLELGRELHVGLFRILQEQLSLLGKHPKASKVRLDICLEEGDLVMQVVHDVPEPAARQGSDVLNNILVRVESLQGSLQRYTQAGDDTILICRFPLVRNQVA